MDIFRPSFDGVIPSATRNVIPRPWSEDTVRLRRLGRSAVVDAGLRLDPVHDQAEAVRVEDRVRFLDEHRAALEPHPRVDVLLRQRRHAAVRGEVELHEDEVPELDEAIAALAVRPAVGSPQPCYAPVVVELSMGQAGLAGYDPRSSRSAGTARSAPAGYAPSCPGSDGDLVLSDSERRIAGEGRWPTVDGVEAEVLRHELPGEVDGAVPK